MINQEEKKQRIKKIIIWSVVGIFAVILLADSFYTIKSTERGVLSTFGKINDVSIGDGLHAKMGWQDAPIYVR